MMKPLPTDLSFESFFWPNSTYSYFEEAQNHPFNFNAESFDIKNAWWLAEASMLVYTDQQFVQDKLVHAGFDASNIKFFGFDQVGTQCVAAHNDDFILIAFRGTEAWEKMKLIGSLGVSMDILRDIDLFLVNSGHKGKVHNGFQKALDEVWKSLSDHIGKLGEGRKLWLTGHSLGAALATLAASRVKNVQGVYTFGSPLVGDKKFKRNYQAKTFRFVNNKDIVTQLPPKGLYTDVGKTKFIDAKGNITDTRDARSKIPRKKLPGGLNSLLGPAEFTKFARNLREKFRLRHITDHAPIFYVVKIWNSFNGAGNPIQ